MKRWERSLYIEEEIKNKDDICIFCKFNCSKYERECKRKNIDPSGRRWAGGFNFYNWFICGSCADLLRDILQE